MVKKAEAESKTLQGRGIAGQRAAIIDALRQSFETFRQSVDGATSRNVLMMVLTTQYLDTIKEIGAQARTRSCCRTHRGLADIFAQLQQAVAVENIVGHDAITAPPGPAGPVTRSLQPAAERRCWADLVDDS